MMDQDFVTRIGTDFNTAAVNIGALQAKCVSVTAAAASKLISVLEEGGTVYLCGNGGSAAQSQHFAAELTGSFRYKKRLGLAAVSLTTDTSALTSIANDFVFEEIFSRQIEALAGPKDVLIALSTSGKSENVIRAMKKAREDIKMAVIGLSGPCPSKAFVEHTDILIPAPKDDRRAWTAGIQEAHLVILHTIAEAIDFAFTQSA